MTGDSERHVRLRHPARVDLIDRDYRVLNDVVLPGLRANGDFWQQNYLIRRIVNRWVEMFLAGRDNGVLPEGFMRPDDGAGESEGDAGKEKRA